MTDIRISPTFRCAECGEPLLEVRRTATDFGHNLWCPRCDRDLLEQEQPVLSDPSFLDPTEQVLDRALEILGFHPEDESAQAEQARTWIAATFDDDARWLETSPPEQIRRAYQRWHTMTILRNGEKQ